MKTNEVILILVCFTLWKTTEANVHEMIEQNELGKMECIDQYDVDDEILDSFFSGKIINVDKELKCFLHCEMLKDEYMKENGQFNVEKIAEDSSIELSAVYAALRFCGINKNDDLCEKAYKFWVCVDEFSSIEDYK